MRVLILGGNIAGLLSALQLHREGDEVSVIVQAQEATLKPIPPMVFTDPGPWGARQSVLDTVKGFIDGSGDFRIGQGSATQLPWITRYLRHRAGAEARSQSLRALAMARRGKLLYEEVRSTAPLLPAAEPLPQISIYDRSRAARAHYERGPVWHMGSSRPSLCPLSEQTHLMPELDMRWARQKPTLTSGGMMVGNSTNVVTALRHHLSQIGVRFIYDRTVRGVKHIGKHLHGVTLSDAKGQLEELDTDLVIACSVPAAWPVLKAVDVRPDLALVKSLNVRVQTAGTNGSPLFLHDKHRGLRLIRQDSEIWALGPTWLGGPGRKQDEVAAQLMAEIARYFGPNCIPVGEVPAVQTCWVAPDGLPVISRTSTRNLFLNIGHHSATAPLAFGAATLLHTMIDQALNSGTQAPARLRWSSKDFPASGYTEGQIHA